MKSPGCLQLRAEHQNQHESASPRWVQTPVDFPSPAHKKSCQGAGLDVTKGASKAEGEEGKGEKKLAGSIITETNLLLMLLSAGLAVSRVRIDYRTPSPKLACRSGGYTRLSRPSLCPGYMWKWCPICPLQRGEVLGRCRGGERARMPAEKKD